MPVGSRNSGKGQDKVPQVCRERKVEGEGRWKKGR